MKRVIWIILFCLMLTGLSAEKITGKVVSVKDGDTIELLVKNKTVKVRFYAIDCPEKDQDFGTKAKMFTSSLVFGKTVTVDIKDTDQYGRSVGEVFLPDKRSLNEVLLQEGYAWHYKQYNKDERLAEMENNARDMKKGLWSTKSPTPPWEFRKDKRTGIKSPDNPKAVMNQLKAGAFIASSNSKKVHRSTCRWAKKIPKENRVYFNSSQTAKDEGYEPCADCRP